MIDTTASETVTTGHGGGVWPFGRPSVVSAVVTFSICTLFPLNTATTTALTTAAFAVVSVGGVISAASACRVIGSAKVVLCAALSILLLFSTALTLPGRLPVMIALISAFWAGAVLSRSIILPRILGVVLWVQVAGVAVPLLTGIEIYPLMGVTGRVIYEAGGDGARVAGLMGHPLLTAYTVVLVLVMRSITTVRPALLLTEVIIGGGLVCIGTGTRSALLCLFILLITQLLIRSMGITSTAARLFAATALTLVLPLGYFLFSSVQLRVFEFGDVTSESSFIVRAGVLDNLQRAISSSKCDFACSIFGPGFRASTNYLTGRELAALVRTFDNIYATVWFDFRWLGLVAIVALAMGLWHATRSRGFGSAIAVTALIGYTGMFFDVLYSFSCLAIISIAFWNPSASTGRAEARDLRVCDLK